MSEIVDRWVRKLKGNIAPVGEMTHWERLEAAFNRRRSDLVPVAPELDYYQITHAGYSHQEVYNDADKCTDACLKTWEDLRTDAIWMYLDIGHQLEAFLPPEKRAQYFTHRGAKDYLVFKPIASTLDEAIALFEAKPWEKYGATSRAATHYTPHMLQLLEFQEKMDRSVPVIVGAASPTNQAETVVEVQQFVRWTITEPREKVRHYLDLCLQERLGALDFYRDVAAKNGARFFACFGGARTWGPRQLEEFGDVDRAFVEKATSIFPHVFWHICGHNLPEAMRMLPTWKGLQAVQYDMQYYSQHLSWAEWCESIAKLYSGTLCAMNSPTTQAAVHDTPAEVKTMVREFIDSTLPYTTAVVMPGCEIDSYSPQENVRAMIEAARERRVA